MEPGDYANTGVVAAVVVGVLVLAVFIFVYPHAIGGAQDDADIPDIPDTGMIDRIARDADISYTMNGNVIEYSAYANLELKSSEDAEIIFVMRFRDIEMAAPCILSGGSAEIPCRLPADGDYHPFRITADFKTAYPNNPPIVNLSAFDATADWPDAARTGGVLDFQKSGQEFLVGDYSVFIKENPLYRIKIRNISVVGTGLKQYKLTASCRSEFFRTFTMNAGEKNGIPDYCGGFVTVEIPEKNKISITTSSGDEWSGRGEKIEVLIWRHFEDFDCGGFSGAYRPFDSASALSDDNCINHFAGIETVWAGLGDGYDTNLRQLPLVS